MSIPESFQHIRYTRAISANRLYDRNQLVSTPSISIKYSTGLESYLVARYRFGNDIGSLQDVYDGYIVQNFNQLTRNSIPARLTSLQSASLTFHYWKSIKLFFFSTMANYSSGRNNSIANSLFSYQLQVVYIMPYQHNFRNLALPASLSKFLFPLKTTVQFKSNIQQNEWVQMQNGVASHHQQFFFQL